MGIIRAMTEYLNLSRTLKGLGVGVVSFAGLGTVSALWENPLFIRMTPAGDFEIAALGALSILLGVYVAIRRPFCSAKTAGTGGVLGFLGIACPICNKVLLLLFGGELLMTYYEPVRIYLAFAGVFLAAAAVAREWTLIKRQVEDKIAAEAA